MAFDPIGDFDNMFRHRDFSADFEAMHRTQDERAGRFDAEGVFKHLLERMKQFQAQLPKEKEAGLQLANFGLASGLHIRSIAYRNPNIIEFIGVDADGETALLVQHISQLNFMLTAVSPPKDAEPYRIGFRA